MIYLAMFSWGWPLLSGLTGLAMGWIAVVHRSEGLSKNSINKIAILIAALVVVSILKLVPGRAGYWLDLGLVMLAVYLVGCAIGSWLRSLVIAYDEQRPPT